MTEKEIRKEELVLSCVNDSYVTDPGDDLTNSDIRRASKTGSKPVENFEDLLPHIGEFGIFQALVVLVLFFAKFVSVVVYMSQQFMVVTPKYYWCKIPELSHKTPEERLFIGIPSKPLSDNGSELVYEHCLMYDLNYTTLADNDTINYTSVPIISCKHGIEYNFTGYYKTITTELDWVCHNDWKPNAAQSIFFLGSAAGTIIFSFISDRFGRRTTHVVATVWSGVFGVASAFSWNFTSFVVFRTLVGFGYQIAFSSILVFAIEFVGIRYRTFVVNIPDMAMLAPFSASLPWIAYGLQDWKKYTLVLHSPLFLAIFVPFIVPESTRWKISRGKVDEVIKNVKFMARLNRKEIDSKIFEEFKEGVENHKDQQPLKTYSTWDVLVTPNVRRILAMMCFIWGAQRIGFDTSMRNFENLGFNPYLSFSLSALTEIPTGLVTLLSVEYFGRRWSLSFSSLAASVLSFVSIAFMSKPIGLVSLAFIVRFLLNICYNTAKQIQTEVYPTVVRSQALGFTEVFGHIMTIVAPQILYLAKTHDYMTFLIMGILYFTCAFLIFFVPETAKQRLPETLKDGEMFGKDKSFWSCLPFRKEKNEEFQSEEGVSEAM